MISIESTVNVPTVIAAVKLAEKILSDDNFYKRIAEKETAFDYANKSPAEISALLQASNTSVKVTLYTSRRRSRALAYEDARYPGVVFLNTRRLDRSAESIASTIIHECVHAVDREHDDADFGHGGNSSRGKTNTAPYWIDDLAYEILTSSQSNASVDERVASLAYDLDPNADDLDIDTV